MTGKDIVSLSLDELSGRAGRTRKEAAEGPDLGPEFWQKARLVRTPSKTSVHLRVDSDVLDFFKKQGKGHLTRMNAVLRAYVDAHR